MKKKRGRNHPPSPRDRSLICQDHLSTKKATREGVALISCLVANYGVNYAALVVLKVRETDADLALSASLKSAPSSHT